MHFNLTISNRAFHTKQILPIALKCKIRLHKIIVCMKYRKLGEKKISSLFPPWVSWWFLSALKAKQAGMTRLPVSAQNSLSTFLSFFLSLSAPLSHPALGSVVLQQLELGHAWSPSLGPHTLIKAGVLQLRARDQLQLNPANCFLSAAFPVLEYQLVRVYKSHSISLKCPQTVPINIKHTAQRFF